MTRTRPHMFNVMTFLFKLWLKYPSLRFGQLILNAFKGEDIYYIEDEDFIKQLKLSYKIGDE